MYGLCPGVSSILSDNSLSMLLRVSYTKLQKLLYVLASLAH